MGESTTITWTHHSWNPWWGCVKVSEGCKHCYAESFSKRTGLSIWGPESARRFFGDKHWAEPLKWNRAAMKAGERRRVFCASMADVFEDRHDLVEPRRRLFELIRATPNLDWLLLTKRPENFEHLLPLDWGAGYPNVWLGVSAENQARWNQRVTILARTPAVINFVSYEPALEAVNPRATWPLTPDWVICGGESGTQRRPWDDDWARQMRDACRELGIAFFYKQPGARFPATTAPLLDGQTHHEYPTTAVV
jgi:protein gp37